METVRIFLTGGTGYVGTAVLQRLLDEGHEVRVLVRAGGRPLTPGALAVPGDLQSPAALDVGTDGVDAVVHLVGIIRERPEASFRQIHVEGTRSLLQAAERHHVGAFVHMSALGADAHARTGYFRTKGEAEELVRSSALVWTIFRPSLVFGPGGPGPNFLSDLRTKLLPLPWHPLFGKGDQLLQPVALRTVSEAFAAALRPQGAGRRTYPLAGPEVITFREVLRRLAAAESRPFRPISLPIGLMRILLPLLEYLPGFPLTSDQFTMLLQGSWEVEWRRTYDDLGLTPVPFTVS